MKTFAFKVIESLGPALNKSIQFKHSGRFMREANKVLDKFGLYFAMYGDTGLTLKSKSTFLGSGNIMPAKGETMKPGIYRDYDDWYDNGPGSEAFKRGPLPLQSALQQNSNKEETIMDKTYLSICIFLSSGKTFSFLDITILTDNESTISFKYTAMSDGRTKTATFPKKGIAGWSLTE
jgi:hypothetical protein